jgi:hypothetical protein
MNRLKSLQAMSLAVAMLAACGGEQQAPAAGQAGEAGSAVAVLTPDEKYGITGKPEGPVKIDYRIIGTPVVGQPLTIELELQSNVDDRPVTLSYSSQDSTAMTFPESQERRVSLAFEGEERLAGQRVTVVPAREGRLFLNVTAQMQSDTGSLGTVIAVPIQVGAAPRQLQDNGVVTTDEDGELIREMPASEN